MTPKILVIAARDLPLGWRLPDDARAAIIVGDSVHEVLPKLAPGSIGGLITDPPYSSGGAFRGDRVKGTGEKYLTDNATNAAGQLPDFFGDTRSGIAHLFWLEKALALGWAACADGAFCGVFTDWRQLATASIAFEGAGFVHRGTRPWVKPSGTYRQQWHYPGQDAEFLMWGTRGPLKVPEGDWWTACAPSPWMHKAPRGDEKRHQTEKPLQVMRDLVKTCPPGAVILDPFAGSGTTLEAALIEGRRAIGIELSPEYARVIADRLGAVALPGERGADEQLGLFGGAP